MDRPVPYRDISELSDALAKVQQALATETDDLLRETAMIVTASAMRRLNGVGGHIKRIDTGRLRGGWGIALASLQSRGAGSVEDGGSTWEKGAVTVYNGVEYAAHVEYGTATMEPGWHLHGAAEGSTKILEARLAELIEKHAAKALK